LTPCNLSNLNLVYSQLHFYSIWLLILLSHLYLFLSILIIYPRKFFSTTTSNLISFSINLTLCLSCPFGSAFLQLYSLDSFQKPMEAFLNFNLCFYPLFYISKIDGLLVLQTSLQYLSTIHLKHFWESH